MMWTYTLTSSNKLQARDVHSFGELRKLSIKAGWLWIDCMEPVDEELEMIAELLKETRIISMIKKRQIFSQYERINGFLLISIPLVVFEKKLETFPIYVFAKEKMLLTVRSKNSSKSIDNSLKTFQDCILRVEFAFFSPFIISRLFHEVANENLNVMMVLRERVDEIEESVLAKPGDKGIGKTVFAMKREVSALERTLWTPREIMLNVREGVVPTVEFSEMDRQTLGHAINKISRELSLINSCNDTLDSILQLQDLGMIHRVERILMYLTLVTLLVNVVMILLEVGIVEILSG